LKHVLGELSIAKLELKGIRLEIGHTTEMKNLKILEKKLKHENLKFKESNTVLDDEFIDDKLKEYKNKSEAIINSIEPESKRRYTHHKSHTKPTYKEIELAKKEKQEAEAKAEFEAEEEWHRQRLDKEKKEVTPVFFSQIVVKE
jgi:hypothetical protein